MMMKSYIQSNLIVGKSSRRLRQLKIRLKEAGHPVGTKRPSFIDLPPEDHVYGLKGKHDKEGASLSN